MWFFLEPSVEKSNKYEEDHLMANTTDQIMIPGGG